MSRVVIAAGTGLIGRALVREFGTAGYEVVVLSRSGKPVEGAKSVQWDAKTLGAWARELEGADAIINLAGEPIAERWTEENKRKILESRVESTRVIGVAIAKAEAPPRVWVNSSAVGYYGDTGDKPATEASPPSQGFLAEVCVKWEAAMQEAATPQTRQVRLRTGIVMAPQGGVLEILKNITKWFLGGAAGSGRQFIPWIHVDDIARLYRWAVDSDVSGPINGVAPTPARNSEFMAALRKQMRRPWSPPAPRPILAIATSIIGVPVDTVMESTRAVPEVARDRGFEFRHPDLKEALRDLLG